MITTFSSDELKKCVLSLFPSFSHLSSFFDREEAIDELVVVGTFTLFISSFSCSVCERSTLDWSIKCFPLSAEEHNKRDMANVRPLVVREKNEREKTRKRRTVSSARLVCSVCVHQSF